MREKIGQMHSWQKRGTQKVKIGMCGKKELGRIYPSSKEMQHISKLDPHVSGYLIYEM